MNTWKLAPTALIGLLTIGTVWANFPDFDELDQDGNGYIDEEEAMALPCLAEHFASLETKSPKGLNRKEFEKAVGEFCQRR
jgi:hypothetical protein